MAQDKAHKTPHTEQAHSTPVNGSHGAQDTEHATQHTPRGHTGEQEPSCPGHRPHNTTHRACAPVNRLRRLKLHGQNAPKTAPPRHCEKIVLLGGT